MGHPEHQLEQLLEEQWPTHVTLGTNVQEQLQWPARLMDAGVLDQFVMVLLT